ncbi:MAG: hypothetical protein QG608_3553 [Actinomycetota bacterium]|nr:hypothetical protein [Actinomycetota bacterium]
MNWTPTSSGHEVSLLDGKLVARNSAGRRLKSVPAAAKDDPVVIGLRHVLEWLGRHEVACAAQVETWMVHSLPLPLTVLSQVWTDPSWQRALRDLVVRPYGETAAEMGLLRDVDAARGVGVVTLDGDSVWVQEEAIALPHPVLLPDLDEFREFVVDLGAEQVVPQLFRETSTRPDHVDLDATSVQDWAGGRFQQLRHLTSRATSQGYTVRGGYATVKLFEDLRSLEARFWVGSEDPSAEAETGELGWIDANARPVRLGEVGPVAWSEGARLAAWIFAGRVVDEEVAS